MYKCTSNQRSLVKGFFVKKDLQVRLTLKIVFAVFATAVITTAVIAAVYLFRTGNRFFYYYGEEVGGDLLKTGILQMILPSLLIAELISILLGVAIGLFSSRKMAVPLFRIEKWLANILQGKFGSRVVFREKEEFHKVSMQCNLISESLVGIFSRLHGDLAEAEKATQDAPTKERISKIRKRLPDLNPPSSD